jgi:putative toxin-antitoxin system antitoxin component (TIGR02293 family)
MGGLHSADAVTPVFQPDLELMEKGVPLSALDEFTAHSGISLKDLLEVVIPARTLKHRRQRKEPFSLNESDRLARVARIYALAVKVFGSAVDGREWLTFPIDRFHGRTALEMLRSEVGGRQVEEMLYQIDEGVFA